MVRLVGGIGHCRVRRLLPALGRAPDLRWHHPRLPRLISHNRALDIALTSRGVEATEDYDIGLTTSMVPAGEALATATELALETAKFPLRCLQADRRSSY